MEMEMGVPVGIAIGVGTVVVTALESNGDGILIVGVLDSSVLAGLIDTDDLRLFLRCLLK